MVLEKDGKPFKKYICQSTAYEQFGDPEKKALPTIYRIHSLSLVGFFKFFERCSKASMMKSVWNSRGVGLRMLNKPSLDGNLDVSKNRGTPKSSILIGFSILNHPFWGTTIFGNTHLLVKIFF